MTDPIDTLDSMVENVDPTKLGLTVEHRYLDRQIVVTISASDDATFNVLSKAADLLQEAYKLEMQHLHSLHSSKP